MWGLMRKRSPSLQVSRKLEPHERIEHRGLADWNLARTVAISALGLIGFILLAAGAIAIGSALATDIDRPAHLERYQGGQKSVICGGGVAMMGRCGAMQRGPDE